MGNTKHFEHTRQSIHRHWPTFYWEEWQPIHSGYDFCSYELHSSSDFQNFPMHTLNETKYCIWTKATSGTEWFLTLMTWVVRPTALPSAIYGLIALFTFSPTTSATEDGTAWPQVTLEPRTTMSSIIQEMILVRSLKFSSLAWEICPSVMIFCRYWNWNENYSQQQLKQVQQCWVSQTVKPRGFCPVWHQERQWKIR